MESRPNKYPNRLVVTGWGLGGRWGVERYLYTIHRLTGIGLVLYFILHIFLTATRTFGQESWESAMSKVGSPFFMLMEFIVIIGFVFHAFNGIRLILVELGFAVGRPEEPVYPYRSSINTQRPLMIVMMLLAGIFIILGGYDMFAFAH